MFMIYGAGTGTVIYITNQLIVFVTCGSSIDRLAYVYLYIYNLETEFLEYGKS